MGILTSIGMVITWGQRLFLEGGGWYLGITLAPKNHSGPPWLSWWASKVCNTCLKIHRKKVASSALADWLPLADLVCFWFPKDNSLVQKPFSMSEPVQWRTSLQFVWHSTFEYRKHTILILFHFVDIHWIHPTFLVISENGSLPWWNTTGEAQLHSHLLAMLFTRLSFHCSDLHYAEFIHHR